MSHPSHSDRSFALSWRDHAPQAGLLAAATLTLAAAPVAGLGPAPRLVLGSGLGAAAALALARLWDEGARTPRLGHALLTCEALTLGALAATPGVGEAGPALAAAASLPLLALSRTQALVGAGLLLASGGVHAAGGTAVIGASPLVLVILGAVVVAAAVVRPPRSETHRLSGQLRLRNRQLAAANAVLMEQNEALDAFNSAVSHDLRSPLTALRLSLECAAEDVPTVEARESVEDALLASSRMEAMVKELLALSRAGRQGIAPTPVDMGEVAQQAVDQLRGLVESQHAVVELRGPLPEARGSAPLLAQVVQNLVENGVKYGSEHGAHVRVLGGRIGDEVYVEVEDNGEGVPEGQRQRIFSPFVQLDGGRDGVGTGLALTRRIVAAHGGRIQVSRSAQLGGATFRVFLPAGAAATPEAPPARGIVLPFPGPAVAPPAVARQARTADAQPATGTV